MNALKGSRTARVFAGIALLSASALVIAGCASTPTDTPSGDSAKPAGDLTLKMGSLLPQTGELSFLGPPMEAGSQLAVQEVNDADAGIQIDLTPTDEGDTNTKAYETSISKLQSEGVSAVVEPQHPASPS
ncbi:ABC transporter substrate-binding protein [Microbacterium sp. CH12i]|uniref:ABC transporter substrate-binding protein n=1 Tax=Microbacterium sp. CH12i TaxID=1479651 RepID=UPI000AD3A24A|nr:ABC transporter substrate-binding protein [Microbacterium sp. CH12i]